LGNGERDSIFGHDTQRVRAERCGSRQDVGISTLSGVGPARSKWCHCLSAMLLMNHGRRDRRFDRPGDSEARRRHAVGLAAHRRAWDEDPVGGKNPCWSRPWA